MWRRFHPPVVELVQLRSPNNGGLNPGANIVARPSVGLVDARYGAYCGGEQPRSSALHLTVGRI